MTGMQDMSLDAEQILQVNNFEDLLSIPFSGVVNAICWSRKLAGNFAEIVDQIKLDGNIAELDEEQLNALELSEQGQIARAVILNDLQVLRAHGASPVLNLIQHYERDEAGSFFPTDVYSYHVDRSPVATDTFLCTYYGDSSEIIANSQAEQKVLVPEIREQLKKIYTGDKDDFELFLSEHFLDLHYRAKPQAVPVSLGIGNIWRLAVDHPDSQVLPCIHRAPLEKTGKTRLLLIC